MQHAAAEADDGLEAIVSNLIIVVGHVRDSLGLINSVLARETLFGDPDATVIVLDDVTPQYQKARHALHACSAELGGALQSLFDARASSCRPCHDMAVPASQKA